MEQRSPREVANSIVQNMEYSSKPEKLYYTDNIEAAIKAERDTKDSIIEGLRVEVEEFELMKLKLRAIEPEYRKYQSAALNQAEAVKAVVGALAEVSRALQSDALGEVDILKVAEEAIALAKEEGLV